MQEDRVDSFSQQLYANVTKMLKCSEDLHTAKYLSTPPLLLEVVYSKCWAVSLHTLYLSDGPAFPVLAPCIYRYITTGSPEVAVQFVSNEDYSPPVADMLSKVRVS